MIKGLDASAVLYGRNLFSLKIIIGALENESFCIFFCIGGLSVFKKTNARSRL